MRTLTLSHDYTIGLTDFLALLADAATWEALGSEASTKRVDPDTEVTVRTAVPAGETPPTLAAQPPRERSSSRSTWSPATSSGTRLR